MLFDPPQVVGLEHLGQMHQFVLKIGLRTKFAGLPVLDCLYAADRESRQFAPSPADALAKSEDLVREAVEIRCG